MSSQTSSMYKMMTKWQISNHVTDREWDEPITKLQKSIQIYILLSIRGVAIMNFIFFIVTLLIG